MNIVDIIKNSTRSGVLFYLTFIFLFDTSASAQKEEGVLSKELQQLYRIDLLPQYRIGSEVNLISTYDKTGGNDDGFSGKYSFVRKEGKNLVLADLKGPGVVHRIHTPTPTDKMLAFYFDGEKTPRIRLPFIELFSGKHQPFQKPLVGNEVGGYYCYVPIEYEKSLKIVYEGDDARFHQIQYRQYPENTVVKSFDAKSMDIVQQELKKIKKVWGNVGTPYWENVDLDEQIEIVEKKFTLESGSRAELFKIQEGGRILGFEIERDNENWHSNIILEAHWDNEQIPAILSPVNDFFGYFFNKVAAQSILLGSYSGHDYCYIPMPFDHSASLSLKASPSLDQVVTGKVRVFYTKKPRSKTSEGKLYTVWRREKEPEIGSPYLIMETKGVGQYIGTILQAQGLKPGTTEFFEGDDVKVIDGVERWHGGGSEDYFNGGWYWILNRWDKGISLPIHGALGYSLPFAQTGGYRFYLTDKVPFDEHFLFTMEHGPEGNKSIVDYTSLAFYYGESPSASALNPALFTYQVRPPTVYEYHVRDFLMELGAGTTAKFIGYSNGLEISGEIPVKGFVVDDAERGEAKGQVRIDLKDMLSGRYRLSIFCDEFPEGGEFSIWRRQEQIFDWVDTYSPIQKTFQEIYCGDIELTDQIRSITIRTKTGKSGGSILKIRKLILEQLVQKEE